MWQEIITNYLVPAVITLLSGLFAYLGAKLKKLIETKINNQIIKEIVEDVVMYTEQKCKEMTSSEKFDIALQKASLWISQKGIKISEAQLEILIEASVNNFYGKE